MIRSYTPTKDQWPEIVKFLESTGGMKGVTETDTITLAVDEQGTIVGLTAGHPVVFWHEFRVAVDMRKRQVAESMWNYGLGSARAAGYNEGIMVIDRDNAPMLRFAGEAHACPYGEPETDIVYLVQIV